MQKVRRSVRIKNKKDMIRAVSDTDIDGDISIGSRTTTHTQDEFQPPIHPAIQAGTRIRYVDTEIKTEPDIKETSITPSSTPSVTPVKVELEPEKKQTDHLLAKIKLELLDSIHDFYKKRGQTNSEDDEGLSDQVFETTKEHLREKMSEVIQNVNKQLEIKGITTPLSPTIPDSGNTVTINQQLKDLSSDNNENNVGSATSAFELNTEKYFESHPKYGKYFMADNKSRISYQTIITTSYGYNASLPIGWSEYINNENNQRIIEIYDDANNQTLTLNDILYDNSGEYKRIINTFIICYMYGKWDTSYITTERIPQLYITFDAAGKYIKKLMFDDPRIHNLLTPQNISDSATTSFNQLGDKINFEFPVNNSNGTFSIESDVFNRYNNGMYDIQFENKEFGEQNRYGFRIRIDNKGKNIQTNPIPNATLDFDEEKKDGPSVNYLTSLIYNHETGRDIEDPKNSISTLHVLNDPIFLNKFIETGMVYDLKRMGDHAQGKSSKILNNTKKYPLIVLATLDRLCGLHSRLIEQPCFFHNNETITLYRYPININETQRELNDFYFRLKETQTVLNALSWTDKIYDDLSGIRDSIHTFIDTVTYPVKFNIKNTDELNSKNIIDLLLKIKYLDILSVINDFITTYDTIKDTLTRISSDDTYTTILEKHKTLLNLYNTSKFEEYFRIKENQETINKEIQLIYNLKQTALVNLDIIRSKFNISIMNDGTVKFDTNIGNPKEITLENGSKTYITSKTGSNSHFQLYFSPYRNTFNSLTQIYRFINNHKSVNRLSRNKMPAFEYILQTGYFDYLKKITQFFNVASEELEKVLFILVDDDESVIKKFKDINVGLTNIYNSLREKIILQIGGNIFKERKKQLKPGISVETGRIRRSEKAFIKSSEKQRLLQKERRMKLKQLDDDNALCKDFSEILFEVMSRCSEFYYSIFSTDASKNIDTFINLLLTADSKIQQNVRELYEECSMWLRVKLFDIEQYDAEYGDQYTFSDTSNYFVDMIKYLFLYDKNHDFIDGDAAGDAAGDGNIQSVSGYIINDFENIYGYNIVKDPSTSDKKLRSQTTKDSFFDQIALFFNKSSNYTIYHISLSITFSFALMYDLYSKKLLDESRYIELYKSIVDEKPLINLINRYDNTTSIKSLYSNLSAFLRLIQTFFNRDKKGKRILGRMIGGKKQ